MRTRSLERYGADKRHRYKTFEAWQADGVSAGVTSILSENRWLDFRLEDNGADVTVIYFHAAFAASMDTYPFFGGAFLTSGLNVNKLSFSDPAAGGPEALLTSWFIGTRRVRSQEMIARIVEKYARDRPGQKIVFFGASAGGFASLYFSSYLPGSVAVAVNPVTDVVRRPATFPKLVERGWPGFTSERVQQVNQTSVLPLYATPHTNRVLYLQNLQDPVYKRDHMRPMAEVCRRDRNLWFWLGAWGEGHVTPPKDDMLAAVEEAIRLAGDPDATAVEPFVSPLSALGTLGPSRS